MSEKSPEETLMTSWADAQQKMLVGWLDLLQGTEQPSRKMFWSETVKTWQSMVQETMAGLVPTRPAARATPRSWLPG